MAGNESAGRPDLALYPGHRLTCRLSDDLRHTAHVTCRRRRTPQLLDSARDRTLVIAGLLQVLAKPVLVGLLFRQRNMRLQVGLQFGLLHMRLVQPLNQLGVPFVQGAVLTIGVRVTATRVALATHS